MMSPISVKGSLPARENKKKQGECHNAPITIENDIL